MLIPNKFSGYFGDGRRLYLGGGKGGDVPAPDPRLVEAQIKSLGIQDKAIDRVLSNAESLMPLQREQMQFGLDAARTAYRQSQEDRSWMVGRRGALSGLQDRMVNDAASFNLEQRQDMLAARANADVTSAFDRAKDSLSRDMARRSVGTSAGNRLEMMRRTAVDEARAKATAANKTREAARMEGFALTDRATNALAGYPALGMQATSAGAGFGGVGLTLANAGLSGMNSGFGAAGSMAGSMGQNAGNMYGVQAQAYGQAQGQAGEMWGSILGAGATMGAAAISDRRLKQDIEVVGRDERTGLNLYEFAYLGEPRRRFRGVMADEVESKFPDAVVYDDLGFASVDYGRIGLTMQEV